MNGNRTKIKITNKKNQSLVRVCIKRSNVAIYASLIDDTKGLTLASVDSRLIANGKPVEKAFELGKSLAVKAKELKISQVVIDRNGYRYHGQVKSLVDGAREAGLKI